MLHSCRVANSTRPHTILAITRDKLDSLLKPIGNGIVEIRGKINVSEITTQFQNKYY